MENIRAVSLAIFATSFLVGIAAYQMFNHPGSLMGDAQRVSMYVPSLDMQPLFFRSDREITE